MSQPFIGEIRLLPYDFAPVGWAFCNGQLMPINDATATLFTLIGTTYGGDGVTTFALPDLRGKAPIHHGNGPGLGNFVQGEIGGSEEVLLSTAQIPAHVHQVVLDASTGTVASPNGSHLATSPLSLGFVYGSASDATMPAGTMGQNSGGNAHENRQPFLALNYNIALQGVFPTPP